MNSITQFKKIPILPLLIALALVIGRPSAGHATDLSATPVIDWRTRGAACDRPAQRGPRELRQQISRRGGRIHGNRPCRNLRCGSRDRGRL